MIYSWLFAIIWTLDNAVTIDEGAESRDETRGRVLTGHGDGNSERAAMYEKS